MGTLVRALNSITLGVDKERREVRPGDMVELDDEQLAELKSHDPPCIQDAGEYDREQDQPMSQQSADVVSRVAEPETPPKTAQEAPKTADSNVDRSKPPADDKDEL